MSPRRPSRRRPTYPRDPPAAWPSPRGERGVRRVQDSRRVRRATPPPRPSLTIRVPARATIRLPREVRGRGRGCRAGRARRGAEAAPGTTPRFPRLSPRRRRTPHSPARPRRRRRRRGCVPPRPRKTPGRAEQRPRVVRLDVPRVERADGHVAGSGDGRRRDAALDVGGEEDGDFTQRLSAPLTEVDDPPRRRLFPGPRAHPHPHRAGVGGSLHQELGVPLIESGSFARDRVCAARQSTSARALGSRSSPAPPPPTSVPPSRPRGVSARRAPAPPSWAPPRARA